MTTKNRPHRPARPDRDHPPSRPTPTPSADASPWTVVAGSSAAMRSASRSSSALRGLALGAGALYAYDQQYAGRVLPGVRVGAVDLSGSAPDAARAALSGAYASLSEGQIVLSRIGQAGRSPTPSRPRPDVEALLDRGPGRRAPWLPGRAGHRDRPDRAPRDRARSRGSPSTGRARGARHRARRHRSARSDQASSTVDIKAGFDVIAGRRRSGGRPRPSRRRSRTPSPSSTPRAEINLDLPVTASSRTSRRPKRTQPRRTAERRHRADPAHRRRRQAGRSTARELRGWVSFRRQRRRVRAGPRHGAADRHRRDARRRSIASPVNAEFTTSGWDHRHHPEQGRLQARRGRHGRRRSSTCWRPDGWRATARDRAGAAGHARH